jgi:hypothetical protein
MPLPSYAVPSTPVLVASGSTVALNNLSVPAKGDDNVINMFSVADDATVTDAGVIALQGTSNAFFTMGIDALGGGGARVFGAAMGNIDHLSFCWRDVGGAQSCTVPSDGKFYAAAVDPASGMYALAQYGMAATGAPIQPLYAGSFNPAASDGGAFTTTKILATTAQTIEGFGFADSQHVAWLDSTGNVWITPTTTLSASATNLSAAADPDYGTFAAGSNHVAWLAGQAGHVVLAELDGGVAGPPEAVDSGEAINQVAIAGADLFWTDGVSVYSIPLP